jgi:predicted nucleotidyltransferase
MARSKTEIRQIVREYVRVLEPTIRVDRVILYGSYASGHPHNWSDIDLAVISRDFAKKTLWHRQGVLGHVLKDSDTMIEALGYSVAEYTHAQKQTFLGEIKRTGKVVYNKPKRRNQATTRH